MRNEHPIVSLKRGQLFPTSGRTRNTPVSGRPSRATTSIDGWADRIGAPYVVDRAGAIEQDVRGHRLDLSPVTIEFANELALTRDGDRLHTFGMNTSNTVYPGSPSQLRPTIFDFFA
jgi:hypothetical protein